MTTHSNAKTGVGHTGNVSEPNTSKQLPDNLSELLNDLAQLLTEISGRDDTTVSFIEGQLNSLITKYDRLLNENT